MSLAAERLELAALAAIHEAAPPSVRSALGLAWHELDGVVVSVSANDPSILLNRTLGFGVLKPAVRDRIREVQAAYRQAGVDRYFFHVHPEAAPAELRGWLEEEGLRSYRRWAKFVYEGAAAPDASGHFRVERVGARDAEAFGRIAAAGFDFTDPGAAMLAALVDDSRWRVYMTFDGDEPAGTGAMFVQGDAAWLDFGVTAPAHRCKGSQRQLLARRVADALSLGCKRIMTTTGEWVEGDPQHSYKNIERTGFRVAYLRDNYVPARA